jgi:hypothetical protein
MLDEAMKNSDSFRNNSQNPSVIPQIPLKISEPSESKLTQALKGIL